MQEKIEFLENRILKLTKEVFLYQGLADTSEAKIKEIEEIFAIKIKGGMQQNKRYRYTKFFYQ